MRVGCVARRVRHACGSGLLGAAVMAASLMAFDMAAQAAPKEFTLVSPTVRTGATMPDMDVGARGNCKGSNQSHARWSGCGRPRARARLLR